MPGLMSSKRWDVLPQDVEAATLLCGELGIDPLVARVLVARGFTDVEEARQFIEPSLKRDWVDPMLIPGMREATDRVVKAIRDGERIAVFGDFDVDGITSTCLLTLALRTLGAVADPYIPHRFGEGYGLTKGALKRVIKGSEPDLIITVDNGIAASVEVMWLQSEGIDVVVTDHHEPGDLVPQGVPVTDPKLSDECPSRELAGAGVALKLVCEVGRVLGMPDLWWDYVDLAALGTVSDMMLLQGENRSLVAHGIELIRKNPRPGLLALAATSGIDLGAITSDTLPFSIIPRLNAAGRMGTTEVAFDLLISEDPIEASRLAAELERTNNYRRETEARLSEEALKQVEATYGGERVIVLAGEGWHEGVKGIVASRVVSSYHVPTIIFTVVDGIARGSGRSVGQVDLFHAVEQCSDLLVRFGGHAGAVGVTCAVENLDEFRSRLQRVMELLPEEEFQDRGEVAGLASLREFSQPSIEALEMLQPFGQGNKRPLFGVRGVSMRNRARVGFDGNHLRFVATDGVASVAAIMFRTPNIDRAYGCDEVVDLVVDAVNETWQGRTNPKLKVQDIIYRDESDDTDDALVSGLMKAEVASTGQNRCERVQTMRDELKQCPSEQLDDRLRSLMIGDSELLPAQREALDLLGKGQSTMCVMATGRGKSLIFHLHAARVAIKEHKASIFVYPLRALVADQAFHLQESFARLGLAVRVLTGETTADQRRDTYAALRSGKVDVLLTTPEYLAIHTSELAVPGGIGFLVIDEAHHAGSAKGGNRSSYTELPRIRAELGSPVCLAVTATAPTPIAREVCRLLDVPEKNVIIDCTVRDNLDIVDYRDLRDRETTLISLVSTGEKTVIYVNSRGRAVELVGALRSAIPELGHKIAFYHAGLSRELRLRVERAFRDDTLCCIVSTSAFGEGVNLPGIRDVVLYHMPFGYTEFNQMSGRAGRDGKKARIFMLYGSHDARINERLLESSAPPRNELSLLYRTLMTAVLRMGTNVLGLTDDEITGLSREIDSASQLNETSIESGLGIFNDLGFLDMMGYEEGRRISMVTSPEHVALESSIRYVEGRRAIDAFGEFREWALSSLPSEMLARMNRPIVPGFGNVVDR